MKMDSEGVRSIELVKLYLESCFTLLESILERIHSRNTRILI